MLALSLGCRAIELRRLSERRPKLAVLLAPEEPAPALAGCSMEETFLSCTEKPANRIGFKLFAIKLLSKEFLKSEIVIASDT